MRSVLLIAGLAGCSSAPKAAQPPAQTTETLWDSGTFVTLDKEVLLPDVEEKFEIFRTADGYRFSVSWKRPTPTGERADGEGTLFTDEHFSPLQGAMRSTLHMATGDEITRSTLTREPDGRISTEVIAADGNKEAAHSSGPNDWFIGGSTTAFLTALCQADASMTSPRVYPDKVTTLAPPKQMPIEGTERNVTARVLVYELSHHQVIAVCENGKLAGEVSRGTTIVRTGDLALARVLEKWFR